MRSSDNYKQSLLSLLPKGRFWNNSLSSTMTNLWHGVAEEFVRIEGRMEDLFNESLIKNTSELLEEHEEDYGLVSIGTTQDRINLLLAKKLAIGENHDDYFIEKAKALGYTITIGLYDPSWVGITTIGDYIVDQTWVKKWVVWVDITGNKGAFSADFDPEFFDSIPINSNKYYYTHSNQNIETLISEIDTYKPAHTRALYHFTGAAFSTAFNSSFDSIPSYDRTCPPGAFDFSFDNSFHNIRTYDGVILTGAFNQSFSIDFDRYSGGAFSRDFAIDFNKPN